MAGLPETLRSEGRAQSDSKSTLALEESLLLRFCLPLRFGEGFDAVGGVFEFLACQKLRDGEDLQPGIAARKFLWLIKSRRRLRQQRCNTEPPPQFGWSIFFLSLASRLAIVSTSLFLLISTRKAR